MLGQQQRWASWMAHQCARTRRHASASSTRCWICSPGARDCCRSAARRRWEGAPAGSCASCHSPAAEGPTSAGMTRMRTRLRPSTMSSVAGEPRPRRSSTASSGVCTHGASNPEKEQATSRFWRRRTAPWAPRRHCRAARRICSWTVTWTAGPMLGPHSPLRTMRRPRRSRATLRSRGTSSGASGGRLRATTSSGVSWGGCRPTPGSSDPRSRTPTSSRWPGCSGTPRRSDRPAASCGRCTAGARTTGSLSPPAPRAPRAATGVSPAARPWPRTQTS
mmetsp:Transcript_18001/g.47980  ORF Transcript_18001/g.47980 Transcript_18001/m.47980 type:complete len:277 (-) Transcript_18001:767-1597(-)